MKIHDIISFSLLALAISVFFQSCASSTYKTYDEKLEMTSEDPEPNYSVTTNKDFQNYTNFMFIGNRIENFGTYFNTYFNALENFEDAFEDYQTRLLENYSERLDSIFVNPQLSQEAADKFNKAIEKASKVIQYHKSSSYMPQAVLIIGKSYFYLGDYLKAERKFGEFISKLTGSEFLDEAVLFLSRTQLRMNNLTALERLQNLIKNSKDDRIKAMAFQTLAEYYIFRKDYESAVSNYKKSIKLSSDNEFKAQMQYLIASVVSRKDALAAAEEYKGVLDFGTSFDLEYFSRYNYAKNLILGGNFNAAAPVVEQLKVKYKDDQQFQSDIDLLKARYHEQKKDYKKAVEGFKSVIRNYPKTVSAADAAYYIANYYENQMNDYLNAYRYYKFSLEQNSAGHYNNAVNSKINIFKRYFELRSAITGTEIKTDYSEDINKLSKAKTGTELPSEQKGNEGNEGKGNEGKGDEGQPKGKPKGQGSSPFHRFTDSPVTSVLSDSTGSNEEKIAAARFELAELFIYELNKPDSAESYLLNAFEQSGDYEFKSKVLFSLADLYKTYNPAKSEETLRRILQEFSSSSVANASRRLLNLPVEEEVTSDEAGKIYSEAEMKLERADYRSALNDFMNILNNYPASVHFSRSAYAAGWIYENIFSNSDSAFAYYEKILTSDPKSDFARVVAGKVDEYKKINTNDTAKTDTVQSKTKEEPESEHKTEEIQKEKDVTNPDNMKKEDEPPLLPPKKK